MLPNADSCLRRLLRYVVEKLLVGTKFAKREETGKRKLLEGGFCAVDFCDGGSKGCPASVAYQTVKGALILMARALAFDHAKEKIRVNVLAS